ncbi:MAG: amidohydrolase [Oscillospiraceae bacterium]|jgi:5-methylthioadenosine/S-adenosylhomocysteine deaminase|nr:amidohydrolase [Oscillospiraceae bacterium]
MNIVIRDILTVLPDGVDTCSVYICDEIIKSVTTAPEGFTADKTIFGAGKMLLPGLINAHTHAPMTILRNCADDLLFDEWLFKRIFPLEDKLTEEDIYWGTMLAVIEMLRSGTTSFIDMYSFLDAMVKAVDETGIRAVLSRGLLGGDDNPGAGDMRLREAVDVFEKYKNHNRVSFMLAPHAPYTCDEGFQRVVAQEAKRLNLAIHTHISEGLVEKDTIFEKYGCTSVEVMDRNGLITDRTVAAHCVHLSDSDIATLAKRGTSVVTNPVSNLKLANGVAPVPKMLNAGINVALGTDGTSSNNTLNMFRELAVLTIIHKGINHDALAVTAEEGFEIATRNGAAAMGRSDIGEIKPGNIADLVIIDLDCPNMQPVNNPMSALAYSTNGSEVETVMVEGKILMENKDFLTIDTKRVYHEVSKICERIGTR